MAGRFPKQSCCDTADQRMPQREPADWHDQITGGGMARPTRQSLGILIRLIISEPDSANISVSGCN